MGKGQFDYSIREEGEMNMSGASYATHLATVQRVYLRAGNPVVCLLVLDICDMCRVAGAGDPYLSRVKGGNIDCLCTCSDR